MTDDTEFRYLIFGALGQDGSYLSEQLSIYRSHITCVVRKSSIISKEQLQKNVNYVKGNILDPEFIHQLLVTYKPTHIFNLASASSVAESLINPELSLQVNLFFVQILIQSLEKYRKASGINPHLIQASSSEMFGPQHVEPINEDSKHDPRSPYAKHKSEAHLYCVKSRIEKELRISTAILFNHESPRRPIRFVSRKISRGAFLISKGLQEKIVLGNIEVKRDWGYAPDYVEAMRKIADSESASDYVVATGELNSIEDMCKIAFDEVGLGDFRNFIESDSQLYRKVENSGLIGDARKILQELHWERSLSFEEMVRYMVREESL